MKLSEQITRANYNIALLKRPLISRGWKLDTGNREFTKKNFVIRFELESGRIVMSHATCDGRLNYANSNHLINP